MSTVALSGLIAILGLQLAIINEIAAGAHKLVDLKAEEAALAIEVAVLSEEIELMNSPQVISEAAEKLGLVVSASHGLINLETGKVINGEPVEDLEKQRVLTDLVPNSAVTEAKVNELVLGQGLEEDSGPIVEDGKTSTGNDVVLTSALIPASPTF
jgi:hypothetical protein